MSGLERDSSGQGDPNPSKGEDAVTSLLELYGRRAIYLHTLQNLDADNAIGRVIVNPGIWQRSKEPSFKGKIVQYDASSGKLVANLVITPEHPIDHFRRGIALILPGHKSIRTAVASLGQVLVSESTPDIDMPVLRSYTSARFKERIVPGATVTIDATFKDKTENSVKGNATLSVPLKEGSKKAAEISGMVIEKQDSEDTSVLLLDQLVEMGAQAAGLKVLRDSGDPKSILPQFLGTGEAAILQSIKAGDYLLVKAHITKRTLKRDGTLIGSEADVEIYRSTFGIEAGALVTKEELVGYIKNIRVMLLPRDEALAKLKAEAA